MSQNTLPKVMHFCFVSLFCALESGQPTSAQPKSELKVLLVAVFHTSSCRGYQWINDAQFKDLRKYLCSEPRLSMVELLFGRENAEDNWG